MFKLPPPKPKTPREEVTEVLAEGIFTLVICGKKPNIPRKDPLVGDNRQIIPGENVEQDRKNRQRV